MSDPKKPNELTEDQLQSATGGATSDVRGDRNADPMGSIESEQMDPHGEAGHNVTPQVKP